MQRIVILGSGFGGINAYLELQKNLKSTTGVSVTLISNTDYFWFTPMAHEVAVGNLGEGSLKQSLRTLPQVPHFDFVEGEVAGINCDKRKVSFLREEEGGQVERNIKYDYLISALGSTTAFFGVPGAAEYSLPIKTLRNVQLIRNTLLSRLEEAQCLTNEESKRALLRFVVVGGGPTGVELAGELADLVNNEVKKYYPNIAHLVSVMILQRGDHLLPRMGTWFSERVEKILKEKGVEVRCGCPVEEVAADGVTTSGEFIPSRFVVWSAGVQAHKLPLESYREVRVDDRSNRIAVDQTLSLPTQPEVFVVGDQALIEDEEGVPYPMRAQFAVRQGRVAARNVVHLIQGGAQEKFSWNDKGFIVSLGHGKALAQIGNVKFDGRLAWVVYRLAYFPQFIGARARLRTALEWIMNIFLPRDLTEI